MSLSLVLLFDAETDGIHEGARCLEVGCGLYSVPDAAMMCSFSSLIRAESNAAIDANQIPVDLLRKAPAGVWAWAPALALAGKADAIVAHNAEFDRRFCPHNFGSGKPWICTMDDVTWPKQTAKRGLVDIALAHGVGVVEAHRAMADVSLIARLLTRCAELGHGIGAMLERGLRPKALFQALVPKERKDEAKTRGFRWNEDGTYRWLRRMAIEDAAALPFETRMVES